jgi:hypothetical protein
VTKAEGAVLGYRDGDQGPMRVVGERVAFPGAGWFEGRRPYLEVRVGRAGNAWSASFNGTPLGRVPDDAAPASSEVRLAVEGGPARVDSVILERLQKK